MLKRIREKIIFFKLRRLDKKLYKLHCKLYDYYSSRHKTKKENDAIQENLNLLAELNKKIIAINYKSNKSEKYRNVKKEGDYSIVVILK